MSDPGATEVTSPTDIPSGPIGGAVALDIAVEEGTLISDPVDERIAAALLQARALMADDESVAESPTASGVLAPAPTDATVSPSSSKPEKPIIGGITLVTKDEWSAWTGGKPNSSWTGLDPVSGLLEHTSPNQLRPVYVSSAQKGYNYRRTGHKTPFKPADDLISFQNTIWNHFIDTGMDSIAYLRDPTDETKMTNVVKAHARYTVQSAKVLAEAQVARYDRYDRTNDMAARDLPSGVIVG